MLLGRFGKVSNILLLWNGSTHFSARALCRFWSGRRLECNWWLLGFRKFSIRLAFSKILETRWNVNDRLRRIFLRIRPRASRHLCVDFLRPFLLISVSETIRTCSTRVDHTLPVLCGLRISISGDLSLGPASGVGDFNSGSSCASSSISVLSVPFESTGDGSI